MKYMLGLLLSLLILGGCVWYVASRMAWMLGGRGGWWTAGLAVTLFCCLYAMFFYASKASVSPLMHIGILFFCYLLSVLVILLLVLLVMDLIHMIFPFRKSLFITLTLLLTGTVSCYGLVHAATPKWKEVTIDLPKLSHEITAVQLTDLHIGHFRGRRHLERLVRKVNDRNPDVIFFTGDFIESWYNCSEEAIAPVRQFKAPVFFVDGNHDTYVDASLVKDLCRKVGFHVLENEAADIDGLQIIGLDYMVADKDSRDDMHAALTDRTIRSTMPLMGVADSVASVVLHHSPVGAEYIEKAGADLFLSGHTHGGQFFPLTLINDHLFEYNRGLYRRGKLTVYVSCGSGTFGLPLRFGTDSELTLLHLKPMEQE